MGRKKSAGIGRKRPYEGYQLAGVVSKMGEWTLTSGRLDVTSGSLDVTN
jgi:hypothetical protein